MPEILLGIKINRDCSTTIIFFVLLKSNLFFRLRQKLKQVLKHTFNLSIIKVEFNSFYISIWSYNINNTLSMNTVGQLNLISKTF